MKILEQALSAVQANLVDSNAKLVDSNAKLVDLNAKLTESNANVEELTTRLAENEYELALAKKKLFGRQSEKIPSPDAEQKQRDGNGKPNKRGGYTNPEKRKQNAHAKAALDAVIVEHPVAQDERRCPHCGENAVAIGDGEPSMEYDWVPGRLVRKIHVVEAARCPWVV